MWHRNKNSKINSAYVMIQHIDILKIKWSVKSSLNFDRWVQVSYPYWCSLFLLSPYNGMHHKHFLRLILRSYVNETWKSWPVLVYFLATFSLVLLFLNVFFFKSRILSVQGTKTLGGTLNCQHLTYKCFSYQQQTYLRNTS